MEPEDYTDEQLYQGVEVRPGVFLVKRREFPPPRILTNQSEGIHPTISMEYVRPQSEVMKRIQADWDAFGREWWANYFDDILKTQKP